MYNNLCSAYIPGRVCSVLFPSRPDNGYDGLTIDGNIDLPSLNPPSGARGAFDYFIRDYQQNVRMILTEETPINYYPATTLERIYDGTSNLLGLVPRSSASPLMLPLGGE